jgi:hypothetical protein
MKLRGREYEKQIHPERNYEKNNTDSCNAGIAGGHARARPRG